MGNDQGKHYSKAKEILSCVCGSLIDVTNDSLGSWLQCVRCGSKYQLLVFDEESYWKLTYHGNRQLNCRSTDPITPPHYTSLTPEPITVIESWNLGFNTGNALKYIARAGRKDGESIVDDLSKAVWYLNREIARLKSSSGERVVQAIQQVRDVME